MEGRNNKPCYKGKFWRVFNFLKHAIGIHSDSCIYEIKRDAKTQRVIKHKHCSITGLNVK